MIKLRESQYSELPIFCEFERQSHARHFVDATPLLTHQNNFIDENIIYLSIDNAAGELAGYFILVNEAQQDSVEFRRILIDAKHTGIGQAAILEMENYCKHTLNACRIWLDVYDDNDKGKHIYEKMGYKRFKTRTHNDRQLHLYDKIL